MKPFIDPFMQQAETYSDEAGPAAGSGGDFTTFWKLQLEFPEFMRLAAWQAGFDKKSWAKDFLSFVGWFQTNSPMHLLDKLEYGTTASYLNPILHSPFEENQIKSNKK